MKRFVKHFYSLFDFDSGLYAEANNLTIVTIAPMSGNGIYVLFEERSGE